MSRKFVRNITGTNLRENGQPTEPLDTNVQNDLLSDGEDVFVRNKDDYHPITDDIKTITVPIESGNDSIKVEKTDKNTAKLIGQMIDVSSENEGLTVTVDKVENGDNRELNFSLELNETSIASSDETKLEVQKTGFNTFRLIPKTTGDGEVPEVSITSANDNLVVTKNAENDFTLEVVDQSSIPVTINSDNPALTVTKNSENNFTLDIEIPQQVETSITSANDNMTVTKNGYNDFTLEVVDSGGTGEVTLESGNEDTLEIVKRGTNDFLLTAIDNIGVTEQWVKDFVSQFGYYEDLTTGTPSVVDDLNDIMVSGVFSALPRTSNKPVDTYCQIFSNLNTSTSGAQIAIARWKDGRSEFYFRNRYAGRWKDWVQLGEGGITTGDVLDTLEEFGLNDETLRIQTVNDYNEIGKTGLYFGDTSTLNTPVSSTRSAVLSVINKEAHNHAGFQIATSVDFNNKDKIYFRTHYTGTSNTDDEYTNDGFTPWYELNTEPLTKSFGSVEVVSQSDTNFLVDINKDEIINSTGRKYFIDDGVTIDNFILRFPFNTGENIPDDVIAPLDYNLIVVNNSSNDITVTKNNQFLVGYSLYANADSNIIKASKTSLFNIKVVGDSVFINKSEYDEVV